MHRKRSLAHPGEAEERTLTPQHTRGHHGRHAPPLSLPCLRPGRTTWRGEEAGGPTGARTGGATGGPRRGLVALSRGGGGRTQGRRRRPTRTHPPPHSAHRVARKRATRRGRSPGEGARDGGRHRGVPRATAGARVPGARPRARLGLGASHNPGRAGAGKGAPGTTGAPRPQPFFPWAACGARKLPRGGKRTVAGLRSVRQEGLGVSPVLSRGGKQAHRRLHLGGRRARGTGPAREPPAARTPRGGREAQRHPGGGD